MQPDTPDFQSSLLGFAFPCGYSFWAKAGWRDRLVCDSACFPLKGGKKLLVSAHGASCSQHKSIETMRAFSARLFGELQELELIDNFSH